MKSPILVGDNASYQRTVGYTLQPDSHELNGIMGGFVYYSTVDSLCKHQRWTQRQYHAHKTNGRFEGAIHARIVISETKTGYNLPNEDEMEMKVNVDCVVCNISWEINSDC